MKKSKNFRKNLRSICWDFQKKAGLPLPVKPHGL